MLRCLSYRRCADVLNNALSAALPACAILLMSGCAMSNVSLTPSAAPGGGTGAQVGISGSVHGGQQPVSGATVQLWQVGTTGYGAGAAPLGSSVLSGSDGSFKLTGAYSCANAAAGANTLVYVTATGGNPGLAAGTNNSALSLMTALGACGNLTPTTFISINEVTTVASVYALGQFLSASGGVGSYAASTQGLTNAFATAGNLMDSVSGGARALTPQGNGVVPQAKINTLANIMSPCVNSAGPTSMACSSLFSHVSPTGGVPSTSLGAMLAIALNPGYNVTPLLGQTDANAPFQPTVSAANDWTLAIGFAAGGGSSTGVALDASGNVWTSNYATGGNTSSVSLLSPTGAPASNSPFQAASVNGAAALAVDVSNNVWVANKDNSTAGELKVSGTGAVQVAGGPFTMGLSAPDAVAVDRSGDIWFADSGNNALTELLAGNFSGTPATFDSLGLNQPASIAFDSSNNAWIANAGGAQVTKFSPAVSATAATSFNGGGLSSPVSIAIDGSSNVWVTNSTQGSVVKLNNTGTAVSGAAGFTGGGLSGAAANAIDGSGSLWVADTAANTLSALSAAGAAISPATGYVGGLSAPSSLAIDASGNVWISNGTPVVSGPLTVNLTEFVGLASPSIMPLAAAVQGASLGQRPGTPAPTANAGGPYSGSAGVAVTFNGGSSSAPAGQTLTYAWSFGDGNTGTGVSPMHAYSVGGTYTVTLTVTATDGASATATVATAIGVAPPTVANFSPASGPVGTIVTVNGTNLAPPAGSATQVMVAQQGGGTVLAPVTTVSAGSLSFVIPAGAATGSFSVMTGAQSAASPSPFTVTTSSTYTLAVSPGTGKLIQGQSTSLAVTISSTNNFPGTSALSVTGVPNGVVAAFSPASLAVGQTALLTLTASSGQAVGPATLQITGASTIDGQAYTASGTATLNVQAATTSFLGRVVVDDAAQEPIAGVTISFTGMDNNGNVTGCSGSTTSDGGGNFLLANLSAACVGPQLISYNGSTASAPAGTYAGVNLSYTLVSGQVTASPVLVHLPRIDNAETVQVQQNASTDQIFYFTSIPGVKVTVYAGTTLSLDDGSQPNPFPLVAISIPLDRLPEKMATTGMLMPFIVAFQPANAVASQPVAVNFPNSLGVAPNTSVEFVTLDPTHGYMVPYGTGTVSNDGTEFVANADPNHPGHAYGLVHFDWHGPASGVSPNGTNPSPDGPGAGSGLPGFGGSSPPNDCGCGGTPTPPAAVKNDPVDLSSGIVTYSVDDLKLGGRRGGLAVRRIYRTMTSNSGSFGRGGSNPYSMILSTIPLLDGQQLINLIMPDGNQFAFNQAPNGTFVNASVPSLRGAILSGSVASTVFTLTMVDGTAFTFQIYPSLGSGQAFLSAITDLNGNKTTLTLNSSQPQQILSVTDPVGRSLTFTYDTSNRITQVVDPIGRKVQYTYNGAGALATVTDPKGGVTKYTYDSSNNLATITDPRNVVVVQNTFNESFDGRITQQVNADGGITKFAYTLQNPTVPASPVLQTVVTDPLGNQTTYRFNMQGFLVSVTDASGQVRNLTRDANHFNLVSDYTGNGKCDVCGDPALGDIHYTFDAVGNVLTETDSLGDKTTFAYDTRFNKVNSVTDALGETTSVTYDSGGNTLSITDANGHASSFVYDQFGEPTQTTDPTGAKSALSYDAFGNIASITNALGNTTYFTFDGVGRLTQVQDALGRKGTTTYDPLDRVVSVTDPLGNKTQLAYDADGGLLSLTDPKGNVTSFTYDSRERLATRTSPLGKSQSYVYDVDSNLTQFTDRRGLVSKYSYDALNRLSAATYQDSTVAYSYDPAGRLLAVTDSMDGSFLFKYDAAGRLLQQSQPTGVIQYTRDALGRVASEQVVGQASTAYSYDPAGNLLSASMSGAGVSYTYDPRNLPLTLTRTNGVVSTFSYDSIGELLSLLHAKGAATLGSFAYTYDAVGNRSQVTSPSAQALTTQSAVATVDSANELLTNTGTSYTYDANGNRLTETTSTGTRSYTWDARNRLTAITDSTGTTNLSYDWTRNLLGTAAGNGASALRQSFVVDAFSNVASFTPTTGSPLAILHGPALDSQWASVSSTGAPAFGIGDALGSTAALTDGNGDVSSELSYEPYGQVNGTVNTSTFPFAFTGRVPIIGNVQYFRNRYYDAAVGRFLSEDPLGLVGGATNLYSYTTGDPVDFSDPTGLEEKPSYPNPLDVYSGIKDIQKGLRLFAYGSTIDLTLWGAPVGVGVQILGGSFVVAGIYEIGNSFYEAYKLQPPGLSSSASPLAQCPVSDGTSMDPFGSLNPTTPFGLNNPDTPFGPQNSRPITRVYP